MTRRQAVDNYLFELWDGDLEAPCVYDRRRDMLCPLEHISEDRQRAIFRHPMGWEIVVPMGYDGCPIMGKLEVRQ